MTNHARWFSGSHSRTSGGNTKRLLAIARQEVLRHAEIVLNPPDSSDFARQPRLTGAASGSSARARDGVDGQKVAVGVGDPSETRSDHGHPALRAQVRQVVIDWCNALRAQVCQRLIQILDEERRQRGAPPAAKFPTRNPPSVAPLPPAASLS